jgi:hypothetical protein
MSDTLKRLEKIEREFALDDEVEPRVYVVLCADPREERSPEEQEEIQRQINAARAAAKKEGRSYTVVYIPTRHSGTSQNNIHADGGGEFRA